MDGIHFYMTLYHIGPGPLLTLVNKINELLILIDAKVGLWSTGETLSSVIKDTKHDTTEILRILQPGDRIKIVILIETYEVLLTWPSYLFIIVIGAIAQR